MTDLSQMPDILITDDLEGGDDEEIWAVSQIQETEEDWEFVGCIDQDARPQEKGMDTRNTINMIITYIATLRLGFHSMHLPTTWSI